MTAARLNSSINERSDLADKKNVILTLWSPESAVIQTCDIIAEHIDAIKLKQ